MVTKTCYYAATATFAVTYLHMLLIFLERFSASSNTFYAPLKVDFFFLCFFFLVALLGVIKVVGLECLIVSLPDVWIRSWLLLGKFERQGMTWSFGCSRLILKPLMLLFSDILELPLRCEEVNRKSIMETPIKTLSPPWWHPSEISY